MLSKHQKLLPFQINGVYFQNDIKGAMFAATSVWGYFSSLFINFTDIAINYVSFSRVVNPLCVCARMLTLAHVWCVLQKPGQGRFSVPGIQSTDAVWVHSFQSGVRGRRHCCGMISFMMWMGDGNSSSVFTSEYFCLLGFHLNTKTFKCKTQIDFPPTYLISYLPFYC